MRLRVKYLFTWNALSDACPKCQTLNGNTYANQDLFQSRLYDPFYGDIWDLDAGHTLAHPNCRCQLSVRVTEIDLSEYTELMQLQKNIYELLTVYGRI